MRTANGTTADVGATDATADFANSLGAAPATAISPSNLAKKFFREW